ncbi:hypothetical protein CCHR01_09088 [Colletotrichum chrysophilum]|uniref:Uncharacterized protein n=1 Tax=Colletotrichum chrysophilum TaxID=1836956 RepID=A0AAD9EH53_9PEZI|nr:hypothetical protein CCHR01_09088 [Colletotrichum chrysophilum]
MNLDPTWESVRREPSSLFLSSVSAISNNRYTVEPLGRVLALLCRPAIQPQDRHEEGIEAALDAPKDLVLANEQAEVLRLSTPALATKKASAPTSRKKGTTWDDFLLDRTTSTSQWPMDKRSPVSRSVRSSTSHAVSFSYQTMRCTK